MIYQESGTSSTEQYQDRFLVPDNVSGRYYLGFDAGTQSVKVAVYDDSLHCVAESSHQTTIRYPGPRMVEMDPDEYLRLTIEGMRDCAGQMVSKGLDPHGVRSIMGDGIICGITGVDPEGDSITPFVNYLDSRTQEDADAINAQALPIWGEETGNADASCMFPALFARWFQRNIPGFQENGAKFVHNAPYVLMHLAGLKAEDAFIDQGAMSGWGLGYDVERKRWSEEQLSILGIDADMMPRIVKPWDIVGGLTSEIAEMTGFRAGTPVCGGAGDTMQSMLGCGMFRPGMAADVAGTCAMFCVSTDGIVPELSSHGKGLIFNSGSLDDSYFYWGFIRTGGLSLRWFKDSVYGGDVGYKELSAEASEIPAGSRGVTFLPYLTGGYGDETDASGAFLNMTLDTDRGTLWRSVLEAIGYDYIGVTDEYRSAGVDLGRITITEGGSADDVWNQMKADMIGSEAVVMKTRGGAVLTDCAMGAHAVGDFPDLVGKLSEAAEVDRSFFPDEGRTSLYRSLYDDRRRVMKGMMPVFSVLKGMTVR